MTMPSLAGQVRALLPGGDWYLARESPSKVTFELDPMGHKDRVEVVVSDDVYTVRIIGRLTEASETATCLADAMIKASVMYRQRLRALEQEAITRRNAWTT